LSYLVLPTAQADIEAIDTWIVENFGEAAAIRAERELYETFELLTRFAGLGIERKEITEKPVRFFSLSLNWIVYTPGDPLLIHRVFPARSELRGLEI
jgi:plasmid stabilization system protein ParE